jgi:hypothetical protein
MRDREQTIAFEMNYCQHYKPAPGLKTNCSMGVDINTVRVIPSDEQRAKGIFGQPCLSGHLLDDATAICPHWIRRTREQGEERADSLERSIRNMTLVGPVVSAWRKKLPRGKSEVIECPACKGRLHLSQAASNGHVHGQCETKECVSWME